MSCVHTHKKKEGKYVLTAHKVTSIHRSSSLHSLCEVGIVFPQNVRLILSDPQIFVSSACPPLGILSSSHTFFSLDPHSFKWVKFLPPFFFKKNKQSFNILHIVISFLPLSYKFLPKTIRVHDSCALPLLVFGLCPLCCQDIVLVQATSGLLIGIAKEIF